MINKKAVAYVCSVAFLGVVLLWWFHGRFDSTNGIVEGPNLKFGESTVISREDAGAGKFPKLAEITIVKPRAKQNFRLGDPIEVEVEVKLNEGTKVPSILNTELKIKGAIADSCTMEPWGEAENGKLVLAGKLKGPRSPGIYQLEAIGFETVWIEPKTKDEHRESRSLKIVSPKISIEVKR